MLLQPDLFGPEALPLLLVVAGLALSIAEALAPGAHFIVIGVALLAAGLVGLVLGPLASPFVLAFLVLVFGALALYGYREFDLYGGKGQAQTSDSADLKGKTGRVTERVTTSTGQVKVNGGGFNPYYSARTMDGEIAEGEEVLVVDPGGGNVITVESLSSVESELDRELERARVENEQTETTAAEVEDRSETAGASEDTAATEPEEREKEENDRE